jgi:hypothetical protein
MQKLRASEPSNIHVYRSEDKNAAFADWERVTDKPIREGTFSDEEAKRLGKFYYYKLTQIDAQGVESEPVDQNYYVQSGKQIERTPETAVMGNYIYWTTDPNLPLEKWTKDEKLITDENAALQSPVKEDFYVYSVAVNFLGEPIGKPSQVTKVIYKGKP